MLDAQSAAPVQASVSPAPCPTEAPPRPKAARLLAAAKALSPVLAAGRALDARTLREVMTRAFEGSDATGAWAWKDAYEAAEAAVVLFVQRYGRAMRREAGSPARMLAMLEAVATLEPSHTRRSEEQVTMQQFSTPLPLAYAALQAAAVRPGDVVLEPSAGTGMLAVLAECALGRKAEGALHLNELSTTRAGLLDALFPGASVTRCNAEAIADHLPFVRPTVVLMNPPFSVSPGVARRRHDADLNHLRSACSMLPPGGRLAAVTSAHCVPGERAWARAFERMDPPARVAFSVAIDGRAYARRGTSFHSRLTVLDRDPAGRAGVPVDARAFVADAGSLLAAIGAKVPSRLPLAPRPVAPGTIADLFDPAAAPTRRPSAPKASPKPAPKAEPEAPKPRDFGPVAELRYEAGPFEGDAGDATAAGPFEPWRPRMLRVAGATTHPTPLVQSGAMAAVPHPRPAYRPMLPERVVAEGLLSDAQLESVVLAGQAHDGHLSALYRIGRAGRPCAASTASTSARSTQGAPRTRTSGCRHRFVSGRAGCSATERGAARAGRSRPSSSISGCGAASARSGSRSPTSSSRTPGATGPRSGAPRATSSRSPGSARGRRFRKPRGSSSRPTRPFARPRARASARGSSRSSAGSRAVSTRPSATPARASSSSTRRTR